MEDHTQMSWKEDNVISQLHNSVDNVTFAVGKALTNPTEQFIESAQDMIERAERSVKMAIQARGSLDPIMSLQEQLNENKEKLNRIQ
jgi:Mg2+ and Co2+ transporter CorA